MKKVPMRQCVGCHNMVSKREMIRVIKTSDGQIMLDATGKKNGRGAYICNSRECLEKAIKSRSLERSLKAAIPSEIYDSLKEALDNIEYKMHLFSIKPGDESRKNRQWRILCRKVCKIWSFLFCNCRGRCIG